MEENLNLIENKFLTLGFKNETILVEILNLDKDDKNRKVQASEISPEFFIFN
ncbi:hypothetical protein ACFP3I_17955 [Chryseobacterium arachidis]|uniref:hypothetical protein n=1 Tax=Chryseobacterium arachidis TaxID=1416778 RepID=UPI003605E6BB